MQLFPIQIIDRIHDALASRRVDSIGVGEEKNGIPLSPKLDPLIDGRQEPAPENAVAGPGVLPGHHDHETGQILVHGPKSVVGPCPQAGTTEALEPSLHEHLGRSMVELVGMQSTNEAHLVRAGLQIGKKIGNLNTRLTTAAKLEFRIFRCSEQSRA